MQVFGFTVNLLTLLAIVLSVGLVVDDAIVVLEKRGTPSPGRKDAPGGRLERRRETGSGRSSP